MLKQRVITAAILVAVFVGTLFLLPALAFQLLVLGIFAVAAWEWANLSGLGEALTRTVYAAVLVVGVLACWQFVAEWIGTKTFFTIAGAWWAFALLWVQGYPSSAIFWQARGMRMMMGALVLIPAGVAMLMIHSSSHGQWLVLGLILLVAAADTGAYFSGKAFGRHKLAPKVSPGKSWEGVVGGLVIVAIVATALGAWFTEHWYTGLIIAIPAAAASVLGDLVESMVKRHRGIKDSGSILPGHGGALDRIDGVTAAAPIFALALLVSGWGF